MTDIITYPENGITYDADDASGYLATRQSGVYSAEEDFAVSPNGDLTVTVSAGQAWVRPQRFRGRSIIMEQPETVTLTAADAVRSRIDRIVLRYDAATKTTSLQVLEGTPDSSGPVAPEITRTALIYDLGLCTVTRPAGSTAITAAHITDTRADESVCGVMRDGVTGIPTAELVAQARAKVEAMEESASTSAAAAESAAKAAKASETNAGTSAAGAASSASAADTSARTASSAASTATAQANTATSKASAAASSASAAAASQTASGQSAAAAKASADAAAKSAKDAAAAANTDTTLSISGAPADAKAVGDAIAGITLPAATATRLGGVKVGNGLSVTGDGTVTVANLNGFTITAQTTDPGAGSALSTGTILLVYA